MIYFYGDFVSLHRRAQLPRHPSDATPSFIKKGTAGKPAEELPRLATLSQSTPPSPVGLWVAGPSEGGELVYFNFSAYVRANSSQRSLNSSPLWPRTHTQCNSMLCDNSSNFIHRS